MTCSSTRARQEFIARMTSEGKGMVAFESLQGLKGSKYFDGEYDKLKWIHDNEFDLLIVDESQEGVDTLRTERAFRYIKRKHTLYLSGTPLKQLASDQFSAGQIFNWSYADEQEAKAKWDGEEYNPYESLPTLNMFTYQLSNMIYDQIRRGLYDCQVYAWDVPADHPLYKCVDGALLSRDGKYGVFSVTGTTSGSPYTVAEEENSTLQPPFSCAAWSTFMKLRRLF